MSAETLPQHLHIALRAWPPYVMARELSRFVNVFLCSLFDTRYLYVCARHAAQIVADTSVCLADKENIELLSKYIAAGVGETGWVMCNFHHTCCGEGRGGASVLSYWITGCRLGFAMLETDSLAL